ncbi:transglutaminase family protein, partial [Francisella tularensis]
KPINSITVNEPENSILSSKKQTWVSISTDVTYEKINETLVNKYENLIHQQIPDELLDDLQALKQQKLKTDIEIIDNVTSLIQNKITYLGDWKKIDAGIYPRTMEDIIDTGYGDCKDYSLLTIASLRYLGLSARFALVNRGEIIQEYSDKTLPSINNFNHAIVYVKGFDEKEYWIDPTNNISMTNGLFPDIANRKALILDPEGFIFTQIPNIDYKKSKIVSIF